MCDSGAYSPFETTAEEASGSRHTFTERYVLLQEATKDVVTLVRAEDHDKSCNSANSILKPTLGQTALRTHSLGQSDCKGSYLKPVPNIIRLGA